MSDRIELQNEAFDLYFAASAGNLTERQREALPLPVYRSLFLKNQKFKLTSISFLRKLYVLLKALNKRFFLIVEDEENGVSPEAFMAIVEAEKNKERVPDTPWENSINYSFCLADKSLVDWLSFLSGICENPAYSYAQKLKVENLKSFPRYKEELKYLLAMFIRYEMGKKKIEKNKGVSVSEFYLLMHLYDGAWKGLATFYKELFMQIPGCSRRTMTDAIRKMLIEKTVEKKGNSRLLQYRITPYGTQFINEVMNKYVLSE